MPSIVQPTFLLRGYISFLNKRSDREKYMGPFTLTKLQFILCAMFTTTSVISFQASNTRRSRTWSKQLLSKKILFFQSFKPSNNSMNLLQVNQHTNQYQFHVKQAVALPNYKILHGSKHPWHSWLCSKEDTNLALWDDEVQ